MTESPHRILLESLVLNDDSEITTEETEDENVVQVKVIEYDQQHGPRAQTADIAPITIHYYEDVQAVMQKHLQDLVDEETFIDDDVLPADLVENEYSRICQKALSAWSGFVDTFLISTEALTSHIVNRAQLSLSGKGMLVVNKERILDVLQQQIAIWDDFSQRFDEFRDSLETACEECQDEVDEGMQSIATVSSQAVGVDQVSDIVRILTHVVSLQNSKLKNTMTYRKLLSDFYMKTCGIFGKSVAAHVQKLQKTLRFLKVATLPLLRQMIAISDQKQSFCRKEVQALAAVQKAMKKHLLAVAPNWFQSWYETVVANPAPSADNIDEVNDAVGFLAAQVSFWIQELLQIKANAEAEASKKRGRRAQVSAPPVQLRKFHGIIDDVKSLLEAGSHSLVEFSIKGPSDMSPIQNAVSNLKALAGDIEKQREEENKQLLHLISRYKVDSAETTALLETLQAILDRLNAKLGLFNVMQYAAAQSLSSIRANITTFVHDECNSTNSAIRSMKAHLKAKVVNHTRQLRSMIEEDTELQRKISAQLGVVDNILKTLQDKDEDYCEAVVDVRAAVKRLFSLRSIYQDLSFVDHVRESAKSEYEVLLNKFRTF